MAGDISNNKTTFSRETEKSKGPARLQALD
jgi:hypothetical protein